MTSAARRGLAAVLAAFAATGGSGSSAGREARMAEVEGRQETPDPSVAAREKMVREQIEARGVRNPRVLAAMRAVPRHELVPEALRESAYEDRPLPIGHGQTISQPYVVAVMTEELDLGPGERVLEVGTGSGYQAAVLAELATEVYTI